MKLKISTDNRLSVENAINEFNRYKSFELNIFPDIENFIKKGLHVDNFVTNNTNHHYQRYLKPVKPGLRVCCTYIIRHVKTGKLYIGSTLDINSRLSDYENNLPRNNKTLNSNLQKIYNEDPNIQFYFILVNTREEAYEIEQWLLDRYWDTGLIINSFLDVKGSIRSIMSESTKEKIRHKRIGIKLSKETIAKIVEKNKLRLQNNKNKPKIKRNGKMNARRVLIHGVMYESARKASKELGINRGSLHYRLNSNIPLFDNFCWIDK